MSLESYRQAVSAAKRADILKASLAHFLKYGFGRAAMAEIAREADVSTATLYKHFNSKEDLFSAIVAEAARVVEDEFAQRPPGDTLAEILKNACRQYVAVQYDGHMNDLMRIVIAEAMVNPALARRMYVEVVDVRRNRVAGILQMIVEMGHLKPHDTQLSSTFLGGMMKEVFVWPALFDPSRPMPGNAEEANDEIVAIFLASFGV